MDPSYLEMYEQYLPTCDVALWIVAARNRALALDQRYLEKLAPVLSGKVIFAISQVDLVDPLDWDRTKNLPSHTQRAHIESITMDRSRRLSKALGTDIKCVPFSATTYFNLMEVYQHIVDGSPADRRWMFDFVRSFSSEDWLNRAEGLTQEQKSSHHCEVRPKARQPPGVNPASPCGLGRQMVTPSSVSTCPTYCC